MYQIFCMIVALSLSMSQAWAMALTQAEYNQQLAIQTKIVNQSKLVLEGENATQDVQRQKKAFCERLNAYREIARISDENPELDQAYLMGIIAHRYLDQQKQSMGGNGITEQYFCGTKVN